MDYINESDSIVNNVIDNNINKNKNILSIFSTLKLQNNTAYTDVIIKGSTQIINGANPSKVKNSIKKTYFKDIEKIQMNGKNWNVSKKINTDIRNEIKSSSIESSFARTKELGGEFIIISEHSDARELCEEDQGKIYSLDGTEGEVLDFDGTVYEYYDWNQTSFGEPAGILGINCRHQSYPYFPEKVLS